MQKKTIKVAYWLATLLFCAGMLFSGISELLQTASAKQVVLDLGYPAYLNIILGVAKVLGALALLQTMWKTLKEWAYAGFLIDFIGAGASLYFAGDGLLKALAPLPFITVLFISYALWKKTYSA